MSMTEIQTLCEKIYLNQESEESLLLLVKEDSFTVAQEYYFAMIDENTVIVVPKIYWNTHQKPYPKSMQVIDELFTLVGYEFMSSFYELEHDDYDNKKFMLETGFIENEALLNFIG